MRVQSKIYALICSVFVIFPLFLFLSCSRTENQSFESLQIKVMETHGYPVPDENIAEPGVILMDKGRLKKIPASIPRELARKSNKRIVSKPEIILSGAAKMISSGPLALPESVPAIDSPFVAGITEVTVAKAMANKDENPENFSYYDKLQGLKHGYVRCMTMDKAGNLWFGTYGGVSRFDGKHFTHYTDKQGLSHNFVLSILEDRSGNLWFGTWGGITKYDGRYFTRYTLKEGLNNNSVLSILEDRSGHLWFGTWGGGVSRYDGKSFTHFTMNEGLSNNIVNSILEDKSGNLWFGTGAGVTKLSLTETGGNPTYTCNRFAEKEGLGNKIINDILEDKNGNLWFGTDGSGVWKLSLGGTNGSSKYALTHFTEKEGLGNNIVNCISDDRYGNLWVGTEGGGVSKLTISESGGSFQYTFTLYTEKEGLSNNLVYSILEDKSGNLWFGTYGGGVSKYGGNGFTHLTEKEGLSNNRVVCVLEDDSGNLWFGTESGGISQYDGQRFRHFTTKEGLSSNFIKCMIKDKTGNLWIGTYGGGVSKYDGKSFTHFSTREGLINNHVLAILEDRSGNLWFGTEGGGVSKLTMDHAGNSLKYMFTHFTEKEGLSNNFIFCMLEDKSGNLWFGTWGGGVTKVSIAEENGSFKYSFTQFTEKEGLSNNIVNSIYEDETGILWFATDGGISKYDGQYFTHLTEKEGLNNNVATSIMADKSGSLWFGTRLGLSKLTKEKLMVFSEKIMSHNVQKDNVFFINYTYDDGFLGIGCNRNSICESADGTIWIGANDRLTAFHPDGEVMDTVAPNIQLINLDLFNENIDWPHLDQKKDTSFLLGNGVKVGKIRFEGISKWYNFPENLSLAYNNNYLTFHFVGITQTQPAKVKYQYILKGNDENWSSITTNTSASYGNLSPGNYTFMVKAMNSQGFWSREFNYPFTIRPPWWKTWWMYTVYSLMLIGSVIFIVWWNGRRLQARAKKLETEVEKATILIKQEKEKSEKLLLNILPVEVAEELKKSGVAKAKYYDIVTVMFTDFKDFSVVSEKVSAEFLVNEIHQCFSTFDNIIQKYKLEKIKTIGDSYMCVGGLPVLNHSHANDMIKAAIEIRDFMLARKKEKETRGEISFELRIGIHSGPVVAGIVGVNKYAYDIWGDTVNIASRMESSGEPGKINISGSTFALIKDEFTCVHRGKIEAKKKRMIDMYFVEV